MDNNWECVAAARMAGLPVHYGSAIAEDALDRLDLNGIGRLLALTSNDEANSLAALHFAELFSRQEVYQLAPAANPKESISEFKARGAVIKTTPLTKNFDFGAYQQQYGPSAIPLFLIDQDGILRIFTVDGSLTPEKDQILISMVQEPEDRTLAG